jgi:hypothetical protein
MALIANKQSKLEMFEERLFEEEELEEESEETLKKMSIDDLI